MELRSSVKALFLGLCLVVGLSFLILAPRLTWMTRIAEVQVPETTRRDGYVVDTPGCMIPKLDPYDKTLKGSVSKGSKIICSANASITYQDGDFLRINRTIVKQNYSDDLKFCEYSAIFRVPLKDSGVELGKDKIRFQTDVQVKDEFIRVNCYNKKELVIYLNLHAFIHPKPHVEETCEKNFTRYKMNYGIEKPLNVLILGVDSVSRLNSIRQLPKTREFLLKNLRAVDFQGYNKVADNTFVNVIPLLVGVYTAELPFKLSTLGKKHMDDFDFIWKHFADMGYRTLLAEDAPFMSTFNYLKAGFRNPPTDYYYRPFTLAMKRNGVLWNNHHDCFSGRLETSMVLDWLSDFITMSKDKPFFAFSFISRLSHDYVNKVGAADEIYYKFLKNLKEHGHLENTVLFYMSDHGMRWGPVRSTYIGKLEERLPMLYLSLPEWFRTKYPALAEHVHSNSYKLTTPFDIHETLKDILYINDMTGVSKPNVTDRGMSLFSEIPPERTCEHASILPHWCTCHSEEPIPANTTISSRVANFTVDHLNNLTNQSRKLCTKLELLLLNKISRSLLKNEVLGHGQNLTSEKRSIIDYQVTLTTVPGKGLFEATVRHFESDNRFIITGEVSRINLYGSQSHCVNDFTLKKYCFCSS